MSRSDGRSHDSKGVNRTRAEAAALKDAVLDAWAAGEDGTTIAKRLWIDRSYLDSMVRRARKRGDPRAAARYETKADRLRVLQQHNPSRLSAAAERRELIQALRPTMSVPSICSILGITFSTVYRVLRET